MIFDNKHIPVLTLVAAVIVVSGCSHSSDGRRGNDLYDADAFEEATLAYQDGLAAIVDNPEDPLRTDYYNNLGAAQYRLGEHQSAQEAFVQSAAASTNDQDRARAAYNAGNNAYRVEDNKLATDFYVQSLVANPASVDAKINYEFVKRKMDEEEQNGDGQQEPPEPSEYAKELKAQADALVAQERYREAFRLMDDGRQVDPTVEAFASFIERVASVADINDIPI
ncbi:MAG: hypothetical protein HKN43_09720 [Rhodothermales bacterium]|nr:hypothetical protein [Rhodothermales bacterium]